MINNEGRGRDLEELNGLIKVKSNRRKAKGEEVRKGIPRRHSSCASETTRRPSARASSAW
jgi:hypothetical protein